MRVLNLLGVEIGPEEDLLPPGEVDNARGYWEPRWMMELNEELLERLGTTWWHPFPGAPGWERSPDLDEIKERAQALLAEKFGSARLWGWKEPRTTLTLPFWQQLVPDARYVICLRNPADAISSIQRRPEPNLPIGEWGDLWLEYTARALKETQGCPRLVLFYEDYFDAGAEQVARLASFLGLDQPTGEDRYAVQAEEIAQDMRHHRTSSLQLAAALGIAPATRALFLALRAAEDARRADAAGRDEMLPDAIARLVPELWTERRLLIEEQSAQDEEPFAQEQSVGSLIRLDSRN
jgi:hypothetical protein